MAKEDLDVIRSLHRAFERGDLETVAEYLHPKVMWLGVVSGDT